MRLRILILALCAVLLLSVGGIVPAGAQDDDEDEEEITITSRGKEFRTRVLKEAPDPDHGRPARAGGFIVNFSPGLTTEERDQVHRESGVTALKRSRLRDAEVVSVKVKDWKQAMEAYRAQPEVESVEPDLIVRAVDDPPNDPCLTAVPNPCSTTLNLNQWGMTKINAPGAQGAWAMTTSSTAVRVAVVDCGVYAPGMSTFKMPDGTVGHPDLRDGKVLPPPTPPETANFSTSSTYDDMCNHGTHVAGIAASNTNNGIGVAGVGYNTKIVNVKVLGDTGSGAWADVIEGIYYAAGCNTSGGACGTRRAEVINMSLGGAASCSVAMQNAITTAWNQGLVIVAAAGNSNTSGAFSPAICNHTVAVSASDSNDNKASFSNYGSWVHVAAPGVSILSTDYIGNYASFNGTSMASPHVAGLAALVWTTSYTTGSNWGSNCTPVNDCVVERILSTAKYNACALPCSANGRIDAAAAVAGGTAAPPASPPAAPSGLAATAASSSQINLAWTDTATNEDGFKIERSDGTTYFQIGTVGANVTGYSNTGLTPLTLYSYRVKSYNIVGDSGSSIPAAATTMAASTIALTAKGYKVKGLQKADLTWSPATSGTTVDVFRNNVKIIGATPNDGLHTDPINLKGAGTYTYKLCEAGTSTACSNEVTIIF